MKSRVLFFSLALSCFPGLPLPAEEIAAPETATEQEKTLLTDTEIDELLAPIALYPDPLVAIILPAATFPADIVLAARYLKAGGDADAVESQPWDDSVKALARYPDVLKWMDENLAWTQQVGAAFSLQPAALLNGTQRLRAAAIAAGNLKDTPEQTVVVEREVVRIVPAQREIIYVPVYDPVYVYHPRVVDVFYPTPLISFSVGYRTGSWLSYYCDWGYRSVVVINRPYRTVVWQTYPAWSCPPRTVVYQHQHHAWRPSPVRVVSARREFDRRPDDHRVARPTANSYVQRSPGRPEDRLGGRDSTRGFARSSTSNDSDRRDNRTGEGRLSSNESNRSNGAAVANNSTVRVNRDQVGDRTRSGSAWVERGDRPARDRPSSVASSAPVVSSETANPVRPSPGRPSSGLSDSANSGGSASRPVGRREVRSDTPAAASAPVLGGRSDRTQGYRRPATTAVAPVRNAPSLRANPATVVNGPPATSSSNRQTGARAPEYSRDANSNPAGQGRRQNAATGGQATEQSPRRQSSGASDQSLRQNRMSAQSPAFPGSAGAGDSETTQSSSRNRR